MGKNINIYSSGFVARFRKAYRPFKGFGLLLFYCHMLMLFSVLVRTVFGGEPEYSVLLNLGKILVPVLFTLTTVSMFLPRFFWPGLVLGFLHLPLAATLVLAGPVTPWPCLAGLVCLAALLLFALKAKLKN